MKLKYFALSALAALFFTPSVQAEEITEDFESVTIVDASGNTVTGNYTAGTGLSNGWMVIGGGICKAADYSNFGLWTTAYNGSTTSLTAQYGSTNSAVVVIPTMVSGKISFYARKTSSSSSSKGYVDLFEMSADGDSFTKASNTSLNRWTLSSTTWTYYEFDLGSTPRYIGISLVRAAIDDVTYNTASLEPHEHSYATEWTNDEEGHWHACQSEVGICDAQKADYAAHDGLTCSVCGYETPGIKAYPWTEDFEGITSGIPALWDNSEGTVTTDSYKWNYYNSYIEGHSLRFDSYNNREGITNTLATPLLYLPAEGEFELMFKVKNPKGGDCTVQIAEYGSAERTTLLTGLTDLASWTEQSVSLAAYAGKAVKVYFCGTSNWGSGDAYIYLDDVTVKERIAHNHDYAETWSYNYTSHWHACLSEVGECDALQADLAAHSFDANGLCTVCGYDQPYMEDFENGIPVMWNNQGWQLANSPAGATGSKMAYAYMSTTPLTTPSLIAHAGDLFEVEVFLPWNDENLTIEYSTDEGETWTVACATEDRADDKVLTTLSWTAPADGRYLVRFSGRYSYIDNVCGFKLAPVTRQTAEGLFGTVCLPYAANVEGAELYTASLADDGTWLVLTEVDTPEAGVPYIYQATADAQTFALSGAPVAQPANDGILKGLFADTKATAGTYVMQTHEGQQQFYQVAKGEEPTLSAYRAYLQVPNAQVKAFGWTMDVTTGIALPQSQQRPTIYDLNGRQLQKLQKGINIVNGVKVLVK